MLETNRGAIPSQIVPNRFPALQSLRVFATVARAGSFTRASEELFLTQSAVTYQIRSLEDYLGTSLFHRHGRGVELTEAGEAILEDVLRGLNLIGKSLGDLKARHRTTCHQGPN